MKKNLTLALLSVGTCLMAGEPFLLKKTVPVETPVTQTSMFSRKQASGENIDGHSNIVVKLNLTQLAFKNLSFQAEYGFHHKMTFALGYSTLLGRELPGAFYDIPSEYEQNFSVPILRGWAITPEFRFYPGGKEEKPAPNGFYLAPYFRYAKYKISQDVSYQDKINDPIYKGVATSEYKGYNAGLMIGRQWIIADHFSIDWWIIGGGYGKAKYVYEWKSNDASLTQAQQDDLKKTLDDNFQSFAIFGLDGSVKTTPKSATMTVLGLPMYSFRFMGLCLGYAF